MHRNSSWPALLLAAVVPATAAPADPRLEARAVSEDVAAVIASKLDLAHADLMDLPLIAIEPGRPVVLTLPVRGETLTVSLAARSVRGESFALRSRAGTDAWVDHTTGPIRTYRGVVVGEPDTRVAAFLTRRGEIELTLLRDGTKYVLEPLGPRLVDGDEVPVGRHVGYRSTDVGGGSGSCGSGVLHEPLPNPFSPLGPGPADGLSCGGFDPICVAELAADADVEFFEDYGSVEAVQDRIESIINTVNLQYEDSVEITHQLSTILVRTAEPDPYTTSNSSDLLAEMQAEWEANQLAVQRDVAELFTGKNLQGSVIGVAYLRSICGELAYSVVETDFNSDFSCATDLSAHELGHNWGADHCSCPGNTMNPSITCTNEFDETDTVPDILQFRDILSCLGTGVGDPPHDSCTRAQTITDGVTAFDTTQARTDGPDLPGSCDEGGGVELGNDLWFDYVASCSGNLTISTCDDASFDTRLAVYNGFGCLSSLVECNDDGDGCSGATSRLTLPVIENELYKIRIGGAGDLDGTGNLTVSCEAVGGGAITLSQGDLVRGEDAVFTVTGAAPGEAVTFGRSSNGVGMGPCPPALGGLCIDLAPPAIRLGTAVADATGTATLTVPLPPTFPLGDMTTQAVVARGTGGDESVKSNTVTGTVVDP